MRSPHRLLAAAATPLLLCLLSCGEGGDRPPPPPNGGVYGLANGCYTIDIAGPSAPRFVVPSEDGETFAIDGVEAESAARFLLRASDLGTYLLYDDEQRYFVAEVTTDENDDEQVVFTRPSRLQSGVELVDDAFRSPAEWELIEATEDPGRFRARHRATGRFLTRRGLSPSDAESEAGILTLYPASDCATFPELTVDAIGEVEPRVFDDGDVYGIVDTHSHLLTNFGFGGGGIFHGAPFHRLGVEHALADCDGYHGEDGRRDLVGFFYDGDRGSSVTDLLPIIGTAMTPGFNHHTDGYPNFTDWPNAVRSSTHQTQYYRWIERAYRAGLRLIVQHATGNSVLCELVTALGAQDVRYSCNDMVSVDRQLAEVRNMERYIDAQSGGPGEGWFRIVESPAEAREVIRSGKLAVVLGIEISNVFDCFITPPPGSPTCDVDYVRAQLDRYQDLGVRVLFPNHKYDNAFTPGDGARGIIEVGNLINSGHWSNFTQMCPAPVTADRGPISFGGINMPRDEYLSEEPLDMSLFSINPTLALIPVLSGLQEGEAAGDHCQNATLTELGETLMVEMMRRGIIIEIDHLPRISYLRAFEMLEENDYPAVGTHGRNNGGALYEIGGMSKTGLGTCGDGAGGMSRGYVDRIALIESRGGYPSEGFGFDLNGFAGGRGPRFGPNSRCTDQVNPITYPFDSFAGDVTFEEPHLGARTVDFNTEGFIHLGLMPELIEDARRDGMTDEELEPLFRSAEAYLRMWERSLERSTMIPASP